MGGKRVNESGDGRSISCRLTDYGDRTGREVKFVPMTQTDFVWFAALSVGTPIGIS